MISTQWPEDDEDIPTYTLEFSDGWQAPEVTAAPEPSEPMRREERQQPAPYQVGYSSRSDIQFNIGTERQVVWEKIFKHNTTMFYFSCAGSSQEYNTSSSPQKIITVQQTHKE